MKYYWDAFVDDHPKEEDETLNHYLQRFFDYCSAAMKVEETQARAAERKLIAKQMRDRVARAEREGSRLDGLENWWVETLVGVVEGAGD